MARTALISFIYLTFGLQLTLPCLHQLLRMMSIHRLSTPPPPFYLSTAGVYIKQSANDARHISLKHCSNDSVFELSQRHGNTLGTIKNRSRIFKIRMYESANLSFSSLTISALVFFGCLCVCVPFSCYFCLVFLSHPAALPHYELFETQAQLIVVTEEFGIRRDLIQKDLRHLQRALRKGGGGGRQKQGCRFRQRDVKAELRQEGRHLFKHWETGLQGTRILPHACPTSTKTLHMLSIWLPFGQNESLLH